MAATGPPFGSGSTASGSSRRRARARPRPRRPDAARGRRGRRRDARGRRARERDRAGGQGRSEPGANRGRDERRRRQRRRAPEGRARRRRRDAQALDRSARLRQPSGRAAPLRGDRRARDSAIAQGLPHVTLDLREEFRQAVVDPFVRAYARGETPNPCIRCNGSFRFTELLAFASRIGAARLATGHYARLVERDGRRLLARAVDETKDQSYMLATLDERSSSRLWFPLGEQTKEQTRAAGRGGRARGRESRREPGGVLPRRRRLPRVPRPARARRRRRARSSTKPGAASAVTTGSGTSRPASAAGSGSRPPSRCTRSRSSPKTNTVIVGPRGVARAAHACLRAAASTPARRGSRRSFATARPPCRRPSSRRRAGSS